MLMCVSVRIKGGKGLLEELTNSRRRIGHTPPRLSRAQTNGLRYPLIPFANATMSAQWPRCAHFAGTHGRGARLNDIQGEGSR